MFGMSNAAAAAAAGEEYDLGKGGVNRVTVRRNNHPTVKPTALMRYLCRLVTPPGGIILDPFAGSGSTGKAAALEGFRFVGVDLNPGYVAIAEARIRAVPCFYCGGDHPGKCVLS
jgi:DNA modification methylase